MRYIINGLRDGFRIGFQHGRTTCRSAATNMQSARMYPEPVAQYLESEQLASRIVGPFANLSSVQVNRFGVIPKSNQPGKWRLIVDLSHPPDCSVNDGIDSQWCSLRYATVDQAITHILQLGSGALLAKVDIEHAYRNIPVHPDDRHGVAGPIVHRHHIAIWSSLCPQDLFGGGRRIGVSVVAGWTVMEYSLHR